jgi:chlorite dismutase
VFTTYFDPGASHRPSWVTHTAAEWLGSQLHFPNWPQDKIASLPAISIRNWAASVGAPLNASSSREDRDAGIQAIAADVPLMTTAQTDILSRPAWELVNQDFVYASWVERATAEAQSDPSKSGLAH